MFIGIYVTRNLGQWLVSFSPRPFIAGRSYAPTRRGPTLLDGIASPDGFEVPTQRRYAVDVRFQHRFQASGDDQEAAGCGYCAAPEALDRALHHCTVEHHHPGSGGAVSSPDGSALAVWQARNKGNLGEVRHAVHRFSGTAQPSDQERGGCYAQGARCRSGRDPRLRDGRSRS